MKLERKETIGTIRVREEGDVPYLTYPMLEACGIVRHGFSTRLGGVSEEHLSSMNLGFGRGDREENVRENFRRIAAAIGFAPENLVLSHQTHTTNVRIVTEKDRGSGFTRPLPWTDVDGLVTNVPELVLATFYADCVPLFFVDPVKKAIGLSHSGWRGTAGKIGKGTVETMQKAYGSRPQDILAAIGPSICQECYEVSEDVISEFEKAYDARYWDALFYRKENGKYQLSLWKANELVFLESGILPEHISVTDVCTCCNPEVLYSHRASGGMRGNLAAFLELKK